MLNITKFITLCKILLLKHDFFGCQLHVHVLEKWLESQTIMYRVKKTIMKGTILNNMLSCIEI